MSFSHLAALLPADARCVLAFSGGLDSSVLLHQLVNWQRQQPQLRVRALHVHHGLSPNADRWAAHCQQQCQQWHIPCEVLRVQVDARAGGIEAAARTARYQALFTHLQPGEYLLTAQHLDDQAETLLLALKRGSGPAGLAAMPQQRQVNGHWHLRPLLNLSRQQLEAYAVGHQLDWIDDESNADRRYDRNFLRLRVLPLLTQRWGHFAEATARSAALCAEQETLLDELLSDALSDLTSGDGALAITPLESMTSVRRAALLRRWLAIHNAAMPSRAMLHRIWEEVAQAREDAAPCVYLNGFEVRRYKGRLWWVKSTPSLTDVVLAWPSPHDALELPYQRGTVSLTAPGHVRLPNADEPVTVRFKASGVLHIVGRNGGRKLKKIWQENNVPPWLRDTTPLLFYGETLIAAAGVFVTKDGWAEEGVGFQWTV